MHAINSLVTISFYYIFDLFFIIFYSEKKSELGQSFLEN